MLRVGLNSLGTSLPRSTTATFARSMSSIICDRQIWSSDANITLRDQNFLGHVEIEPTWDDRFMCEVEDTNSGKGAVNIEIADDGSGVDIEALSPVSRLRILIPQKVNLQVSTRSANCNVLDKVEGDISILTGTGSITAKKLRGKHVTVSALRGAIDIRDVVEGRNLQLLCGKLKVGRIFSEVTTIEGKAVEGFDGDQDLLIESSYSRLLSIISEIPTFIDSAHGELSVEVTNPSPFVLNGFNGNAAITSEGPVSVHFHSCQRHSAISANGNVSVTFQPPADVALEVQACSGDLCKEVAGLAEEQAQWEGTLQRVSGRLQAEDPDEVLRQASDSGSIGKISHEGRSAAGFERTAGGSGGDSMANKESQGSVAITTCQHACVHMLTWMEMVRQRVRQGMQSGKYQVGTHKE